jgi:hypothetical protein
MSRAHPPTKRDRRHALVHARRLAARTAPPPDAAAREVPRRPATSGLMRAAADAWLARFPPATRPSVEHWFRYAARNGSRTPAEVVAQVTAVVGQKLQWSVETSSRERCHATLAARRCDVGGALAYAALVLEEGTR